MSSLSKKLEKLPVILYEESMDGSWESSIPYIEVDQGEAMPPALFIQEYRFTGDTEPDSSGNEAPTYDAYMHMYINMDQLNKKLPPKLLDQVRTALGMQPLKKAIKKGEELLTKVVGKTNTEIERRLNNEDGPQYTDKQRDAIEKTVQELKNLVGGKK